MPDTLNRSEFAHYFAYGSNLLSHRLIARCPSAAPVGTAVLRDHRLAFAKLSWMDGSGKATILPAPGQHVSGVVYRLSQEDVVTLDEVEGVGKGYDRLSGPSVEGAVTHSVESYIASDPREPLVPFDWYLALIVAGAAEHGLARRTFEQLARQPHTSDPDPDRPGHRAARAALSAAGLTVETALALRFAE